MKLIDSHCHINFDAFDHDRVAVVQRAARAGIHTLVVPGVSRKLSQSTEWQNDCGAVSIIQGFGLHPYFINQHQDTDLDWLATTLHGDPAAFIGEVGLDSTVDHYERQLVLFSEQLQLAIEYQRPLVLHHRRSQADLLRLIKPVRSRLPVVPGVLHAFSGSFAQAKEWVALGFMLGVGGTITYQRAQKTRRALAQIPIEFLLLETDAPDMPLFGYQGQRNEPAQAAQVLLELSELQQLPPAMLADIIWDNTQRLFRFNQ